MYSVPEVVWANNEHARGQPGLNWLQSLPALIQELSGAWDMTVGEPFGRLSYNYVLAVTTRDGDPAVLKLGFPGDPETRGEARALELYAGDGSTRLLASDAERGALLIERAEPGRPLHTLEDEEREVEIAADLMQRLWRPVDALDDLITVSEWGRAFQRHRDDHGGASGPLLAPIFDLGERLYGELDASAPRAVLLHGDFHHENVLSASREPWLVIDPKGLVGDPGFEVGTYLNNHWEELYPGRDMRSTLSLRADLFSAALGLDRDRVVGWGIAFCVLSAVWSAENGGTEWRDAIRVAETLKEFL